ncbi:MAG: hypothetical protein R3194_01490 [Limnobacter sp.]|nr:hypothetical protein [Limnobacter sp.]
MISSTPVGNIQTPTSGLTVQRGGETIILEQGDSLQWKDVITNEGATPVDILMPARYAGQGDTLLTLQPGASAELAEITAPGAGNASRTEVIALSEGVELYDIDNEISSSILTPYEGELSGLVGAGLLAGGAGAGAAAGVGAVGLAALAAGGGGGDGGGGDDGSGPPPASPPPVMPPPVMPPPPVTAPPPPAPPPPAPAPSPDTAGLAGALLSAGEGTDSGLAASGQVPAPDGAPSPSDGTEALAAPLGMVAPMLASDQDPTGLSTLVSSTVFSEPEGYTNDSEGVAGALSATSAGLDDGAGEDFALAMVTDPLIEVVGGGSDEAAGLSSGVADVGNALAGDSSELAPLTNSLAPVVGTDSAEGANGLTGTLTEVGDATGLTDVTDPVSMVTDTLGDALIDNSGDQALVETLGTVVGGDGSAPADGDDGGGDTGPLPDPTTLTDMVPIGSVPSTDTDPLSLIGSSI